jgi:hypothetical protein
VLSTTSQLLQPWITLYLLVHAQRNFPLTNLGANGNQFQVNEALLIEQIGFFIPDAADGENYNGLRFWVIQ